MFIQLPIIEQFHKYSRDKCFSDIVAAVIVTVMLIPQSLAYAILAGLPPHFGLYASMIPIVVYSLLGTSTALAVGPVAIASIMTASALSSVVSDGLVSYTVGAVTLAFLSGFILFVMGLLRFGFVANFLSHSVVSGFITASGLIIALGQLRHLFGVSVSGHTFFELGFQLLNSITNMNIATAIIGIGSLIFLIAARQYASKIFQRCGLNKQLSASFARMSPILAVCISTATVAFFGLNSLGVAIVGDIPSGIANPSLPSFNWEIIKALFIPAFFIAIIGYVESISVGRTLGAKRDEKIDANQELLAIGGANLASGFVGAFPVTGGFSRSVVNFDAGAKTQFAGIYTAIGIAIASLFLTPYLYYLPIAMLAATIIVAVLALIDLSTFKHAWHFSKSDFSAVSLTVFITLFSGVEAGVASGIIASILLHLYHTSRPHIAEIGLVPNTSSFRNVKYYQVDVIDNTLALRVDESFIFSNAGYLESYISDSLNQRPEVKDIIIHCGAVNTIDLTGMEMLQGLNIRLIDRGIRLHLSEVKTPVKNLLEKVNFISALGGQLFMSHLQAHQALILKQSNQYLEN